MDIDKVLSELKGIIEDQNFKVEQLEESLASRMLALEDIGWTEIGGSSEGDGPSLENLKTTTKRLREMAGVNPLFVRGAELIFSYTFGQGIEFTNIKENSLAKKVMTNRYNMATLFSAEGLRTLNLASFTDGNIVLMWDSETKLFTLIPLDEVGGQVLDPEDDSKIRYLKRSRTRDGKPKDEWIPLARWKNTTPALPKSIKSVPVSQTKVIYMKRENAQVGWTWGLPWSLAAMVWALAYSTYLQDNAKLVKALSMIAWSLTKTTEKGVQNAAAQFVTPGVGGTAINTTGNAISSVGVPSSQVNMGNGQPLAAMVATTFGVPVIALLSSPGATGGSYGAATTLDTPTILTMLGKQRGWKDFLEEILTDLKSLKSEVVFPPMIQDPAYREVQSITTAKAFGLLHDDEARAGILQILPVLKLHEEMPPKPEKVLTPSGQGVQGAVPGGTDMGQSNHDGDNDGQ